MALASSTNDMLSTCTDNDNCTSPYPYCSPVNSDCPSCERYCVGCVSNSDCEGTSWNGFSTPICDYQSASQTGGYPSGTCVQCTSTTQCSPYPQTQCYTATNAIQSCSPHPQSECWTYQNMCMPNSDFSTTTEAFSLPSVFTSMERAYHTHATRYARHA